MKKIITLVLMGNILFGINSCLGQEPQQSPEVGIIGSWVSEDDTKDKIVFDSKGKRIDYYNNVLEDTYTYSISHACGSESDAKAWFIKIVDLEDSSERCYELYSANAENNKTLSMRDLKTGKIFVYNKTN